MKIHTVELWPGAPELHEVVLHSEHTQALARAEAERDRYKQAWMEFMDRTDWMQEKGQVPAKYLGQHRADVLMAMLNEARAALATQPAAGEPLTVWYGSMPESNGKTNWTAILHRKGDGLMDGPHLSIARSEYPDRVRYEADQVRYIIGELAEEPDILAYDADAHSGYKAPPAAAHGDEAVRKDAERYRWLRDYHIGDDPESINLDRAKRKGLNAAIDAAMRAQAGEGGGV